MAEQHPIPTDLSAEAWRPAAGYEANYEVSSLGRIRRRSSYRGTRAGRILQPCLNKAGYPEVTLRDELRVLKHRRVHRLVAATFLPPHEPGRWHVNHKNGVRTDNRIENLEWCNDHENQLHSYRILGRIQKGSAGSKNGYAKLTEANVIAIRAARSAGQSGRSLAAQYNVCEDSILLIHKRRTWTHV